MERSSIFTNQHYKIAAILAGTLTLIYVLINLFVVGGDSFVISLNDNLSVPLAILTTLLAWILFNQARASGRSRLLWGGLFVGWALWTIAETIWSVYGFLGQEVPFPSLADLFWLIGYAALGFGLYSRLREMPEKLSTAQKTLLWIGSLVIIFLTLAFAVVPTVREFDVSYVLGSIIDVIYPIADTVLLISAFRLLVVYRGGNYGFGWNLLIAGFVLTTISDLVYTYSIPLDLYYPDQKVNLITAFGNAVPYNFAYLLWIFGLYALWLVLKAEHPFEVDSYQPRLVANAHMLVSTKRDGTIFDVSKNFGLVFDYAETKLKSLAGFLGIPEEVGQSILERIRSKENNEPQHILVKNLKGVLQDVDVNGIAVFAPGGEFSGYNLMLRTLVENDYTIDDRLNAYQKSLIPYLRQSAGGGEDAEIKKLLLDYYLVYLKQLHNLVYHTGGGHLGLVFMESLQQTAREHQWQLPFDSKFLPTKAEFSLDELREELPVLLETAKGFASRLIDPVTVEAEMRGISAHFSQAVHKNVEFHSKKS